MRLRHLLHIVLCALCAVACKRVPLYDAESGIYLRLNLHIKADIVLPDDGARTFPASFGEKLTGKIPERMQVNFYDIETHSLVTTAFVGPEGGFIDVAPGVYDILVYNIGTDNTRLERVNSRGSIYAYTEQEGYRMVPESKAGEKEVPQQLCPVIREPDHLYVARKDAVVIPEHSTVDETIEIYAEASTLLETYIFRAINLAHIERVASAHAYITGQARAKCLWDGRYIMDQAVISVDCYPDKASGEIVTVFNTFGKFPNAVNEVFLTIVVSNAEGDKREYVFDVTDQFDNPDNTRHEIIVTEEIDVPEPGSGQGGFVTDIIDWDEEQKDVNI